MRAAASRRWPHTSSYLPPFGRTRSGWRIPFALMLSASSTSPAALGVRTFLPTTSCLMGTVLVPFLEAFVMSSSLKLFRE